MWELGELAGVIDHCLGTGWTTVSKWSVTVLCVHHSPFLEFIPFSLLYLPFHYNWMMMMMIMIIFYFISIIKLVLCKPTGFAFFPILHPIPFVECV